MFFIKKKKLIEIENKIDSVMEQLSIFNHIQEDILSFYNMIENRLDSIEQRMDDNHSAVSQSLKETEASIIEEIDILKKCIKALDDKMLESQKESKERIVTLGESISHSRELLQQLISDDGKISRDKMDASAHELSNKFDMIDLSLRLLLLNSVMDQIEE